MSPESIQKLTPGALAALHELDAATATEVVAKLLAHVHEHPAALENLYASGLLGSPGKPWVEEHYDRAARFIDFACGSGDFERGGQSDMLLTSWLDAVRPLPTAMSRLLFMTPKDAVDLRDYFISHGADPHLPLKGVDAFDKGFSSFSSRAIVFSGQSSVSPEVAKMLQIPADDLPVVLHSDPDNQDPDHQYPPQNLLDVALNQNRSNAAEIIVGARDMRHPTITAAMADSVSHAMDGDKTRLLLRLLGVGAEPANGNWEPVLAFLQGAETDESTPRLLTNFLSEASEAGSFRWRGRPALAIAIERLVEHGLNINLTTDDGQGMVYLASHHGCFSVLDTLLTLGAQYKNVLDRYDVECPDFTTLANQERGKQMLLAHAAHDAMSAVLGKAKTRPGGRP